MPAASIVSPKIEVPFAVRRRRKAGRFNDFCCQLSGNWGRAAGQFCGSGTRSCAFPSRL